MKIALIGYPQSGKRTLFSLLTRTDIIQHRHHTEIISGKAKVIDKRVDALSKIFNPQKITYAETEFLLCPDIVVDENVYWSKQAHQADLLCVVVRAFSDTNIFHPLGSVNWQKDLDNITAELLFADLELVEKRLERIQSDELKKKLSNAQSLEKQTLTKCHKCLDNNKLIQSLSLSQDELNSINSLQFLTQKPILWCLNVDEENINNFNNKNVFTISAKIEQEINSIENKEEQIKYLHSLGLTDSGINRLNNAVYDTMGLMSFYTVGQDEVRAWTIKKDTKAPHAGGKIHSDIARGFIRVEIIKYNDLISLGSEQAVKAHGKSKVKGKDYIIEDGDICHFLFNV